MATSISGDRSKQSVTLDSSFRYVDVILCESRIDLFLSSLYDIWCSFDIIVQYLGELMVYSSIHFMMSSLSEVFIGSGVKYSHISTRYEITTISNTPTKRLGLLTMHSITKLNHLTKAFTESTKKTPQS